MIALKDKVKAHWDNQPCGTGLVNSAPNSFKYFVELALYRYKLEPFILKYTQWGRWEKKKVLEVGCGPGVDLVGFALCGADVSAIDLSSKSVELAKNNLKAFWCKGNVAVGDAENLPFEDNTFDFAWSWGVLHHTPDTAKAVNEIRRVLKPWGKACVMLYNRNSLVSAQMYLRYGLLKGRIRANIDDLFDKFHESPGTKVYTQDEVRALFKDWRTMCLTNEVTPYDLRYARHRFLPMFFAQFVPKGLGFFHVINANK